MCHPPRCSNCSQLSEFHFHWGHSKDSGSSPCQEQAKGNRVVESDLWPTLSSQHDYSLPQLLHIGSGDAGGVVFSKYHEWIRELDTLFDFGISSTNFSMPSGNLIVETQWVCNSLFPEWILSGNNDDPGKISFQACVIQFFKKCHIDLILRLWLGAGQFPF